MFRLLKKTQDLLLSEQKSILSSAIIISFMYTISRILGFIRYRLFAYYFTKEELDVFFASFRIPDTLFEIFVLGALSYSFIPIFIKWKRNSQQFNQQLSSIINIFLSFLSIISILTLIFTPFLVKIITPGFPKEIQDQIVFFTRILILFQIPFLTLGNILQLIAQAEKKFLITVIAPILYNLSIIVTTLLFSTTMSTFAPILGAALGSFLFFFSQTLILRKTSFKYLVFIKLSTQLKEFFSLSIARMLTLITKQIESTVELALASIIGLGSYTSLYLAQRLQFLPVSLIGQALGQAAYPYFSDLAEKEKLKEMETILRNNIQLILFFTIPITSFFVFARTPLVRLFFGGPKFDWDATVTTAFTLSFFALAIPFHSSFYLITRVFFSFLDAKTPLVINSLSMVLNILLNLYFTFVLKAPVWYLALSFSISSFINVLLLLLLLQKRIKLLSTGFFINTIKTTIVATISAFASYKFMRFLDGLLIETITSLNLLILLALTGFVYAIIYIFLSWVFEIKELYYIPKILFKINNYRKKLLHFYTELD